jgi:hypothetical protein
MGLLSFLGPVVLYLQTARLLVALGAMAAEILLGAVFLVLWSWLTYSLSPSSESSGGRNHSAGIVKLPRPKS